MLEDDIFVVGDVVDVYGVEIDKWVDVLNAGRIKGDGAVVDDVRVECAVLEELEGADEDAVRVCKDCKDRAAGILEVVSGPELLAGDREGLGAEVVEELIVPTEKRRASA